jgi:fatty acyl-ACP thioesterase B
MNQDTRRLSKMPDDVRKEISPYFLDRFCMKADEPCRRIRKLGDNAEYIRDTLVVRIDIEVING